MHRLSLTAIAFAALVTGAQAEAISARNNPLLGPDIGLALRKAGLDCAAMAGNYPVTREVTQASPVIVNHVYCDGAPRGQWYEVSVNAYELGPVEFKAIEPPEAARAPSVMSLQ